MCIKKKIFKIGLLFPSIFLLQCVRLLYTEMTVPHSELYTPKNIFRQNDCLLGTHSQFTFEVPHRGTYQVTVYLENGNIAEMDSSERMLNFEITLWCGSKEVKSSKEFFIREFPRSKQVLFFDAPKEIPFGQSINGVAKLTNRASIAGSCNFDYSLDLQRLHSFLR